MAGKRYSAGAIFLQVVPVFADVQRAIEDEAKNYERALGDSMEKAGEKAGDRAGKAAAKSMSDSIKKSGISKDIEREVLDSVAGIDKALGQINTRNLGKKLRSEVKEMRAELASLSDIDLNVDDNLDKVSTRVAAVKTQIEDMRKRSSVVFDIKGLPEVYRKIEGVQKAINKVDGDIKVGIDVNDRELGTFEKKFRKTVEDASKGLSSSMNKEIKKVKADLDRLGDLDIGVNISSPMARRELQRIAADLKKLEGDDVDVDVKVDAAAAAAELAAFDAALEEIDGKTAKASVKTDADKAAADGERAASAFRSFNIVLFAAVSIGPALVPILAGIAGGLLALGPAAAVGAAGLGSVLVGFSGLGDALSALGNQQDQAAATAQNAAKSQVSAARSIAAAEQALADARRNAARAAEDAAERVADARRNAARAAEDAAERVADAREEAAEAIEDALERQKDAQEEYRDSVQEVKDAEEDLRQAREDARKDAETLARRQRQNAVDERQAVLDLFEAQTEYNAVMADGSSTNTDKEQASINLEQAQIALNETRHEQVELNEEAANYAEHGVDGAEGVKSAQERLTEALEDQKEAQEAVKEAAEAADEARKDGAEAVSEALEDQNEILSDNARAIRQALEDQAESHDDNARAIARAKQALSDARRSAVDDLEQIDAQAQAVKTAFDKLGPAGRDFALFLFSLRSGFYEFRDAIQTVMLPAIQEAIEGFIGSANATKAKDAMVGLAAGFGDFVKALSTSFQGPAWGAFFEMLATLGPQIQSAYGSAFISVMEAFANILVTTAPFALRFAEGLAAMMDGFANWTASKEGQDAILGFLAYVQEIGPSVLDFFSGLAGAVVAVMTALAPYGLVVLDLIDGFLNFITNMDKDILAAFVTGATIVLFATQMAYAVMTTIFAFGGLFASVFGPWVLLIVGVAAAIGFLYKTNEGFRDFINEAWDTIGKTLKRVWNNDLKPALKNLWEAFEDLWKDVLQPFFAWLGPILVKAADILIRMFAATWAFVANAVAWAINELILPAFDSMWTLLKWAWENVISPIVTVLGAVFLAAFTVIKAAWDNVLSPVLNAFWEIIKFLWKHVIEPNLRLIWNFFRDTFKGIKDLWDRFLWPILDMFGKVMVLLWDEIIKPVLGRMSKGWEKYKDDVSRVWNEHLKPIFEAVGDFIEKHVAPKFEKGIGILETLWNGLKAIFMAPIEFLVDMVLNKGLIAGFNWIAEKVGSEEMGEIEWAKDWGGAKGKVGKAAGGMLPWGEQSRAVGGVLPGYTPGRDVYSFYNPKLGQLNLSGGEGILRPEVVAAAGGEDWLNGLNRAARHGGVQGVRKAIGGDFGSYWLGGVLPLPNGSVSSHGSTYGFPAFDLNYPGYADYGKPVLAFKDGIVSALRYMGDSSYGRYATINHGNQTTLYAHLSAFASNLAEGMKISAGTPVGYVGDIGNTGTPPTSHLHFEVRGSAPNFGDLDSASAPKSKMPKWAKTILASPIDWMKGLVTKPLDKMTEKFGKGNMLTDLARGTSMKIIKKSVDFVKDLIPAQGAWDKLVGNRDSDDTPVAPPPESGLPSQTGGGGNQGNYSAFKGGMLPYNGTMMYDSGGYLPPGLTNVVNLTGKPEPVFTADQFDGMEGGGDGGWTYAPTLVGTDLTPADLIDDLDFTRRRVQREGKYGRNK